MKFLDVFINGPNIKLIQCGNSKGKGTFGVFIN